MKIYLVTFKECDYDQYDAFVVIAKNKKEVIEKIKNTHGFDASIDWKSGYKTKEIKPKNYKRSTIVLDSFHAG